jgi:hypothetical protein
LAEFRQKYESKLKKLVPTICLKMHGTHFGEKIRPIRVNKADKVIKL